MKTYTVSFIAGNRYPLDSGIRPDDKRLVVLVSKRGNEEYAILARYDMAFSGNQRWRNENPTRTMEGSDAEIFRANMGDYKPEDNWYWVEVGV